VKRRGCWEVRGATPQQRLRRQLRRNQVVAFFGHSGILTIKRIEDLQLPFEFVVRSGRALMVPAYSGTLERGPSPFNLPPSQARERALKWSMDLGRSIDYLATRTDIDTTRLAFYGVSTGAAQGPRLIAVDPRFKTAVLASGGLRDGDPPEVDAYNFAPRVHIPVLMLNGRDDFIFPMRTHQVPLFEALVSRLLPAYVPALPIVRGLVIGSPFWATCVSLASCTRELIPSLRKICRR